jgi:hypothetical protein
VLFARTPALAAGLGVVLLAIGLIRGMVMLDLLGGVALVAAGVNFLARRRGRP